MNSTAMIFVTGIQWSAGCSVSSFEWMGGEGSATTQGKQHPPPGSLLPTAEQPSKQGD